MGHSEDLKNPLYQLVGCVCGWTVVFLYFPPFIWLSLTMVDQTSIKCSIEDFYIDGLQSNNVSNSNHSIIYFRLYLGNTEEQMGVYYDNLNLTLSYYASVGIVPVGNYTITGFHQGLKKETKRKVYVVTTQGTSWKEILSNVSLSNSNVTFRIDLSSAVKFKELFSRTKSKRRKIMAWGKVEVDRITGNKISKKAVELKHMIIHHVDGWVKFFNVFMIIACILTPCWCFCFLGCICRLVGR